MALPLIPRQLLTGEEKREMFKHWFPPDNNNAVGAALDLVNSLTPAVVTPAAFPEDPGATTVIPDGSPDFNGLNALKGLAAGTVYRAIHRDLLNVLNLPFPPGTTGTRVPGSTSATMWVLNSPATHTFPSKTVRVVENDVMLADAAGKTDTHTIHWHGIEPMPMSDGVGKQSHEMGVGFKFHWAANQAGHYFYHCHKNTVLHFEMGLYGQLLVDPRAPAKDAAGALTVLPPFTNGGRGCVMVSKNVADFGFAARPIASFTDASFGPGSPFQPHVVDYDVEALWVVDDIDTLWHTFSVNQAMANNFATPAVPGDINGFAFTPPGAPFPIPPGQVHGQLNDFRPDIFLISGVVQPNGAIPEGTTPAIPDDALPTITGPAISITCKVGNTILARILNSSYCTQQYTLGLDAVAIAMDGRPFGVRAEGKYSKPFPIPANRPWRLTTARRVDFLIKATKPGVFKFKTEFFAMYRGFKIGRAITTITVNP
jgi:Multicopper oxidase